MRSPSSPPLHLGALGVLSLMILLLLQAVSSSAGSAQATSYNNNVVASAIATQTLRQWIESVDSFMYPQATELDDNDGVVAADDEEGHHHHHHLRGSTPPVTPEGASTSNTVALETPLGRGLEKHWGSFQTPETTADADR